MVKIKGDSPFDKYVVQNIEDCMTENIAFHNITFDCKTIKDASGNVFVRVPPMPERTGKWIFGHTLGYSWMKCSECLVSQDGQTACFSYCPCCGARMEGEEHEID